MKLTPEIVETLRAAVQPGRVRERAVKLIEVPSPTGEAGAVADRLSELLDEASFEVERPEASWAPAPAVVTRFQSPSPGKTLQFNAHMDVVHLPYTPPSIENGILRGSGCSDMKGGLAAMSEALIVLKETGILETGGILLTAHDLHETPWGDGSQLKTLIREGYVGDGVLLPEYTYDRVPVVGRGMSRVEVEITREGIPVHEVMGGMDQPSVIGAGAELVQRLRALDRRLSAKTHPLAGRESLFIGKISSGEIFNQSPIRFQLSGTRRWIPGTAWTDVEREFYEVVNQGEREAGVEVRGEIEYIKDAFQLDPEAPLVEAFQSAHQTVTGNPLPQGPKPFVDDGNTFLEESGVPAITHGPNATGAHTVNEAVPLEELNRVALVYACTAVAFC